MAVAKPVWKQWCDDSWQKRQETKMKAAMKNNERNVWRKNKGWGDTSEKTILGSKPKRMARARENEHQSWNASNFLKLNPNQNPSHQWRGHDLSFKNFTGATPWNPAWRPQSSLKHKTFSWHAHERTDQISRAAHSILESVEKNKFWQPGGEIASCHCSQTEPSIFL